MVDHIKKIVGETYRVDEPKETLDDDGGQRHEAEEEDEQPQKDKFNQLNNNKDWRSLFDKSNLWQRNFEVKLEDIKKIKFLGLNLNTNPAILKIRVFLNDGHIIQVAFLSLSRTMALKIKKEAQTNIDPNLLTNESSLWLTLPKDIQAVDDEITNIINTNQEKTFSQTFKMLVSKKTWLEKFGLQDPVSKRFNKEFLMIYITVIVVSLVVILSMIYLLT
ncbi:hypothetical protein BVY03_03095 [bacterium K02(2017)]|nr:hypothetical protein BVY03_03095 [bacterium K02(2017)]